MRLAVGADNMNIISCPLPLIAPLDNPALNRTLLTVEPALTFVKSMFNVPLSGTVTAFCGVSLLGATGISGVKSCAPT